MTLPLQFGLASMVLGLLLFFAEVHGFLIMLLGFLINSQPYTRQTIPLPKDQRVWPHVDVYIPTYNEDAAIVRATLIAATQLRYPADKLHVFVLDDGGTEQKLKDKNLDKAEAAQARAAELQELADRFGATYLTRKFNTHAKAGNINSALSHTSGELVVVFDCDHIPTADFLERTVGFFLADKKLFVLQTPHNFVSPDPVERNLETFKYAPSENELFYDVMQPGLDFWGASFFCGSAAVLRRSVLDELGGISGKTITEDAETTLDAMTLGYRSAYYKRPMVSGLQPETVSGFIVQRVRWAQGMFQILILKNPWQQKGLTLVQRLLYTNFGFYWGFAFARLMMLLAPPAYLIFGVNLCDTTSEELLAYGAPAFIASLISTQLFYGRVRWPFISQLYEITQSLYITKGLFEVFRNPTSPSFNVTPKGETLSENFASKLSWPFYVFLSISLVAFSLGVVRFWEEPWNRGAIAFVLFWAFLDILLLLGVLGISFERRQVRSEPRARLAEPVRLITDSGVLQARTRDASACGVGIQLKEAVTGQTPLEPGQQIILEFTSHQRKIAAVVQAVGNADDRTVGLRYAFQSREDERLAISLAFGSSERLIENNRLRHTGRSIFSSFLLLFPFAFKYGINHLRSLVSFKT